MGRFFIDSYLYRLAMDIKLSKTINNAKFDFDNSNIKVSQLRKELELFEYLNLNLPEVYAIFRNKICFTNPKNITIYLGDDQFAENFLDEISQSITGIKPPHKKTDHPGTHICRVSKTYGPSKDFINYISIYIFINTESRYLASSAYLHEIMHSELIPDENVLEQVNIEVLPIFIELLYGYHKNTNQLFNKLINLSRDVDIYLSTTCDEIRERTKGYISSTVKAINLFELYTKYNQDIINDISNVLKCNNTLENLLDKYEIVYDSYKPDIKKLIKLGNGA